MRVYQLRFETCTHRNGGDGKCEKPHTHVMLPFLYHRWMYYEAMLRYEGTMLKITTHGFVLCCEHNVWTTIAQDRNRFALRIERIAFIHIWFLSRYVRLVFSQPVQKATVPCHSSVRLMSAKEMVAWMNVAHRKSFSIHWIFIIVRWTKWNLI